MSNKTALMEFIADQTGDVVVRVAPSGTVRYISASVRALGHEPEMIIGTDGLHLIHPDDRADFIANTAAAIAGEEGASRVREHRVRKSSGDWIWMEGNPKAIRSKRGKIVELVNIFRDVSQRKAAEALASAESEVFRSAFEHAGVGRALVGLDGRFMKINEAFCEIVGYPRPVMLKLDFQTITHPEDLDADLELLEQLAAGAIPSYRMEKRYLRADGSVVWVDLTVSAVRGEGGEVSFYVAQVQDQSHRRAAEEALRESEQRFRLLAENATDIIALFGADARFTYLSPSIEAVLGYAPAELIGKPTRLIMHPDDYAASLVRYQEHLNGASPEKGFHFEYRALHKSGRVVWLAAHPRPVFDPQGKLVGFQDVVRDVSAWREAQAALADSEAKFRLLAENSSDLIMQSLPDGSLAYVSPSCTALTGDDLEAVRGRTAQAWVHPDDWPLVVTAFQEQVRGAGAAPQRVIEYRVRDRNGSYVWLESAPKANVDPKTGAVVSVTDAARDVTARKTLEARLAEARDRAEAAAQVKADFLSNMSHEIRTPLTAILGYTALLYARRDLPVAARQQIERVQKAGDALLALVNDVLDFSKLEAGQVNLKLRAASLSELMSDTVNLFEAQAAAKRVDLQLAGAGDLPRATIDPDRLRQVLVNLVGNALKFTDAGVVKVACRYDRRAARLRVEITDTGPGMDANQQARLFQRFSQVDGSTTRKHGGTGLGLAICLGITEAMGGEIGVHSTPGQGSTFWFEVPAAPSEAEHTALASDIAVQSGLRILVADDNPVNRELASAVLLPFDAEITEAEDGEAAAELAQSLPFDLILLDLRMPRLDGPGAALRIRGQDGPNRNVPILAFTAEYDIERYGEHAARAFDGVVHKPILGSDFIREVVRHTRYELEGAQ